MSPTGSRPGRRLADIHQFPDLLGVNYYQPSRVGAAPPAGAEPQLWQGITDVYSGRGRNG